MRGKGGTCVRNMWVKPQVPKIISINAYLNDLHKPSSCVGRS